MEQQEQPQEQQEVPDIVQEEAPAEETTPTKSVKNFWQRLDEVFIQNTQLRERMDELVEQFPEFERTRGDFKSFIFQPERLAICSNDDIAPSSQQGAFALVGSPATGHYPTEKFSNFRIRLKRPLRNVKSIQLLSAVIPNAIQNIPDDQTLFFWYKIRKVGDGVTINASTANKGAYNNATSYNAGDIVTFLGNTFVAKVPTLGAQPVGVFIGPVWIQTTLPADPTRPNYYDINSYNLSYLWLLPTFAVPYDFVQAGNQLLYNRTFQDYNDLTLSLNYVIAQNLIMNNAQNDISFQYDDFLNKITMIPSPNNITAGYYYLPAGYEDPNIYAFMNRSTTLLNVVGGATISARSLNYTAGNTLNVRLGFTWNGVYTDPFTSSSPWANTLFVQSLYWYLRKKDPGIPDGTIPPWGQNTITFNSYPDLVNTSCVRVYADFTLGSTQDSLDSTLPAGQPTRDGLLSIVPVNTTNLGVGYYQNNFDNPLTKIPENITEIGITMYTDQGSPYYLPNSATVLLELGITYK